MAFIRGIRHKRAEKTANLLNWNKAFKPYDSLPNRTTPSASLQRFVKANQLLRLPGPIHNEVPSSLALISPVKADEEVQEVLEVVNAFTEFIKKVIRFVLKKALLFTFQYPRFFEVQTGLSNCNRNQW